MTVWIISGKKSGLKPQKACNNIITIEECVGPSVACHSYRIFAPWGSASYSVQISLMSSFDF
ncbi:CLUMA_CG001768, isoform A [Clunio marinus]|uniref:CLUMA_CG001768, isoform A n=1 Tax=Clunio marinus TaxID=568069 RepID=A0A1J1HND6_9DIPT|nr:CLUMA_CG001768, isoform A [Clunio marinus]